MDPSRTPRTWMLGTCLPLWGDRGYDKAHGGFVERFNLATGLADAPMKRLRVQGRQIYAFSHAHHLGWCPGGASSAMGALEFVRKNGWQPGRGWVRSLTTAGDVLDPAIDLYDNAFMLFALGWLYRVTGDAAVATLARDSLEAIRKTLLRSDGLGYHPSTGETQEWIQNPHMHLLEACLVLAESTNEGIYFDEARLIARLFREKFFDARTGTLAEYFDEQWNRMPGERGRIIEPGHQFEWAWLLSQYGRIVGEVMEDEADGLFRFAAAHGVDAHTGLVWSEVRDDGKILNDNFRIWPQTEALKARLAKLEGGDLTQKEAISQTINRIFSCFLDEPERGLWVDLRDRRMNVIVDNVPASTLYHVFLAFAEAERLRGAWASDEMQLR